ncbi:hypothetical protein C8Q77DRAFT_1153680 [Trametes polyzona]|nr:hypothetical protein C8Q77DRAFT_1153680 [Trametes polyzona]
MAANGLAAGKHACKCLNIRIHAQSTKDNPPPVEAGFIPVYAGEEGIRVAHTEVTLRSRSKPVPDPESSIGELTRYTTLTCLICGVPTYRVLQRITPDLINEVGPVLPTDDWVEKELLKSTTGWIEVYNGCLAEKEISEAEASPMYSSTFGIVLPGPKPPSEQEEAPVAVPNARGPSEQGKTHLPELPVLFLPPPFTPAHLVYSHFSSIATERSQKLRDEAEEYIAQVTQQKVVEVLKAEAALKQEVNLVWNKFRDGVRLIEESGTPDKAVLPLRRRGSVSKHARTVSSPVPGTSASVRISSFVPTPGPPSRSNSNGRPSAPSALSASLKTSGFHYPAAQRQTNGDSSPARRSVNLGPPGCRRTSPSRSDKTRVHSPSTASSRTAAISVDPEASIREAYRREMDESKDIATSFRYVMDMEEQMEQHRLEEEAELTSPPVASSSRATAEGASTTPGSRGRSPRVQKSAIKHSHTAEESKASQDAGSSKAADASQNKETNGKGKRKVTFDVQPEVAIIKDEAEAAHDSGRTTPSANDEPIFEMDNETEHSARTRMDVLPEQPRSSPATPERSRTPTRHSHSRSSSSSGLPPEFASLRAASLPAPSAMRPLPRHSVTDPAERTRSLRESLLAVEANSSRPDAVESPIEIKPEQNGDGDEITDPREADLLRLVAASVPSHRSAWKKNSKAWQLFLNRRERKANEIGPETISEEGNYTVVDDFDPHPRRRGFNGVADSDVTDEDDEEDQWYRDNQPIAQSLPIPIGPLGQHMQSLGVPSYQPKTSLSDRPGVLVPPLRNGNPASLRRASYADRDRARAIDPGALDFAVDEDEVEDDVDSDPETGGKARQRALKILKARDEMPAAGMWRSLA